MEIEPRVDHEGRAAHTRSTLAPAPWRRRRWRVRLLVLNPYVPEGTRVSGATLAASARHITAASTVCRALRGADGTMYGDVEALLRSELCVMTRVHLDYAAVEPRSADVRGWLLAAAPDTDAYATPRGGYPCPF